MDDFMLDEQGRTVRDEMRCFVREEIPADYLRSMDRDEVRFPTEIYRRFGHANLLGLRFPRALGGRGLSWFHECAAMEEVGWVGTALGCAFVMPSIVGEALFRFGTPEQQRRFLTPMLAGELVSAEALTEPRGGSDFFGAATVAEDRGDHFVLRGMKRFIVGAEGADFFLVYAKTNSDPKAAPTERLSTFLVERGPGVEVDYLYRLLGTRGGGTGRVIFREVKVPREHLLGPLHGGAQVFNRMMVAERLCSAAPMPGGMAAALQVALRYTDRRKAFGRPVRAFQGVSFQLAEANTLLDASRALIAQTARAADLEPPHLRRLVSECKKFVTEAAWRVVDLAMQTCGGIAYTEVYPLERFLRDTRIAQIWTGTSEIMSALIQHELYEELHAGPRGDFRSVEDDAMTADLSERIHDDEEMWNVYHEGATRS
ncbi:MAG: acyl-CoA dehydrogenase [Deltaproteobacteria bacterium RIFOXYA12_FULL_61_11]|nr:MAG: acyl-CoA dehydrogenase [Deltaproteobacteria bacterium RIFOXYA12_FULL_61_11]